jgi:putative mRNA 3-end processing factor
MPIMDIGARQLLKVTELGLYCERGDFFVDPWRPVNRSIITHAHGDHLCAGCGHYLMAKDGLHVARARLSEGATIAYGEIVTINGIHVSLHPAGHILGSAQIRIEHDGQVCVVSGDYKVEPDLTCATFEPVRCHLFVSECTFGLPIYRWSPSVRVFKEIVGWWRANREAGRASLLCGYSLGKAQRMLVGVDDWIHREGGGGYPGRIYTHGAVETMNNAYLKSGVRLPHTTPVVEAGAAADWSGALVIAPPSAHGSPWMRRFGPVSTAFASGWMRIRGTRRRRAVDRGFVLSDHVDWPGLLGTIDATEAETIWLTHGYTAVVTRWLRDQGRDAHAIATRYEGERDELAESAPVGMPAQADAGIPINPELTEE